MIKSMTGYGVSQAADFGRRFTVEIRSVNHRYSDINVKTPRNYGYLEDTVRKCLSSYVSRGKVDVFITVEAIAGIEGEVMLNPSMAKGYFEALCDLKKELELQDDIKIEHMTRFSDIFSVIKAQDNNDEIVNLISKIAADAAEGFTEMRAAEGKKLYEDMISGLEDIKKDVAQIEQQAPKIVEQYQRRLTDRMTELLDAHPIDEGRLLNEVAIFADRVNVNEELVRLKSHIQQMTGLLEASEPVGRKLDFLIQEMNREINTIGSKSNDISVARKVIDIKSGIEKLREQTQNIE